MDELRLGIQGFLEEFEGGQMTWIKEINNYMKKNGLCFVGAYCYRWELY